LRQNLARFPFFARPHTLDDKDLIYEGIATASDRLASDQRGHGRRQRPDLRRDCDRARSRNSTEYNVKDDKDLIYEGIATMFFFAIMLSPYLDDKDLIYEGIATKLKRNH